MSAKKQGSYQVILRRMSELEVKMDQILEELEEVKMNTAKKKRKRINLLKREKRERSSDATRSATSEPNMPDMGALLNHPLLKSFLANNGKGGAQGIDPNQIAKALKNPLVKSMLNNLKQS